MATSRETTIQEIREWNNVLSNVNNIPLTIRHNYKDQNDIYERLHEYVKSFVESVFGVYTNEKGEQLPIPDGQHSEASKDWAKNTNGKLTGLSSNWWSIALKGQKSETESLPILFADTSTMSEKEKKTAYEDVRIEVSSAFFPAYRALRDSFSKRWFFEWIFNHRQYVAERDALKAMTNLITSMTGFTKAELDEEYRKHCQTITTEDLYPKKKQAPKKEEPVKEVEKQVVKEEVPVEADPVITERTVEKTEKIHAIKKKQEEINTYFSTHIVEAGATMNELAIYKSAPNHLYEPLYAQAHKFCEEYDACVMGSTFDTHKDELTAKAIEVSKAMFETAFKGLQAKQITPDKKEVAVFGIQTLKGQIVAAQKIADTMLRRTPVGFNKAKLGAYGNGYHTFEKADQVRNFVKENYGNKYSDKEINWAIRAATKDLNAFYREGQPDMSHVFKIDYRPSETNLKAEQVALGTAQNMVKKGFIKDAAMSEIINNNIRKWKVEFNAAKMPQKPDLSNTKKEWAKTDEQLAVKYPEYDYQATDIAADEAYEQYQMQKALQKNLNGNPAKKVPPVDEHAIENPVVINK